MQGHFILARYFFLRHCIAMNTASDIIEFIGPSAIKNALGVQDDAVRKAKAVGKLPASWYDTCERLAGRPLPRSAFTFKGAA